MKASDIFIKALENQGVEFIFGVPGEENLDLLESIRKSEQIEFILTRNEQTAVFMAANYGRLTGKAGVAISTLGPGATNMVTGVAYAQLGGMPVIVITGQKRIKKSKQGKFQILDVVSMMKPITKDSKTIISVEMIPSLVMNAFKNAEYERPGVVHIELPEDIAKEEGEDYKDIEIEKIRRPNVDTKAIYNLKERLEKAKTPVILIGSGANRKRITKFLTKLIKKYNIPFFSSQMGKGVVDDRLEQSLGTAAITKNDYIHKAIEKADLLLSIGYDVIEKPTNILGMGGVDVVHINFSPAIIDNIYFPKLELVGDIANAIWQLYEIGIDTKNWDFREIYSITKKNNAILEERLEKEKESKIMMPRRFTSELRDALGEYDILALDNGLYKLWISRNYKAYHPNTILLDNTIPITGIGLASTMSAKLVNKKPKVICVIGDGGFLMNLGDYETAVRLKLDITIIVINDGSYGMIKWKQKEIGLENYGLDFGNPNFVKFAESFGTKGYKVKKADNFRKILQEAINTRGVVLIDLDFKYPDIIR